MSVTNEISKNIKIHKINEYHSKEVKTVKKANPNNFLIVIKLDGICEYKSLDNDYCKQITKGYTIHDMVTSCESLVSIPHNTNEQYIAVSLSKNFMEQNLLNNKVKDKILNFFASGKGVENLSNKKTDPITEMLALEIFNNPYNNELEKLYIEAKTLELIHREFVILQRENNIKTQNMIFTEKDKEAIYYARELLIQNMKNPPSMKKLAKMIAVNDLKLKKGFHKYFNNTPYNLLLEYRLQEGKRLLQNSYLNVNEISEKIGYKYTQSFSTAFYKRFGIRPKELMKKREYYY